MSYYPRLRLFDKFFVWEDVGVVLIRGTLDPACSPFWCHARVFLDPIFKNAFGSPGGSFVDPVCLCLLFADPRATRHGFASTLPSATRLTSRTTSTMCGPCVPRSHFPSPSVRLTRRVTDDRTRALHTCWSFFMFLLSGFGFDSNGSGHWPLDTLCGVGRPASSSGYARCACTKSLQLAPTSSAIAT